MSDGPPPPSPSIAIERFARRAAIVRVTGDADLALAPALGDAIAGEIAAGRRRITIDLSATTFIDCCIVGLLVDALAPLRGDGDAAVLAGATGPVKRVLDLLRIDGMLEVGPELAWEAHPLRRAPRGAAAWALRPGPSARSAAAS